MTDHRATRTLLRMANALTKIRTIDLFRYGTRWVVLLIFVGTTSGCASGMEGIGYYWQSISGHVALMNAARPVNEVLGDGTVSAEHRRKLRYAKAARAFASAELGLPDNNSYRQYSDIGRRHIVWNVFATGELSLELKRWCFPIAGCIGYRGYYDKETANQFAKRLADDKYDVQVGGVPAYSTLGWFDDPIPSTIMRFSEAYIARLIFHELAHQVLYVKNDSTFNESFATAVEIEGLRRWFESRRSGAEPSKEQQAYQASRERRRDFIALLRESRDELKALYKSDETDSAKRVGKKALFTKLRERYQQMKTERWDGYGGYDRWFDRPLGNAHLAAVGAYNDLVPGFSAILAENGNDLTVFYEKVRELSKLERGERRRLLRERASKSQ